MAKKLFDDNAIKELMKSDAISKMTNKSITYSKEFKVAIATCKSMIQVKETFELWNINIELVGEKRIEQCWYRWRRQLDEGGDKIFAKEQRGRRNHSVVNRDDKDEYIRYLERQNELKDQQLVVLKKYIPTWDPIEPSRDIICEAIYLAINNGENINLKNICLSNGFSHNSYHKYLIKRNNAQKKMEQDSEIVAKIKEIKNRKFCKNDGYRKITMTLNNELNYLINHKKVLRIMNKYNLLARVRRCNPYKNMMKETAESKVASNILNREFDNLKPDTVFVTDITYLHAFERKTYYLSVAKDLATREIVAWNVRSDMKIDLSLDIVNELNSKGKTGGMIHSDQGVHYTSIQFQNKLVEQGIVQSMSRRGKCTDNGPMESFFGHLKDEVDYSSLKSLEEITNIINQYMIYYNQQRGQWHLKKMSPIQYRQHLLSI